MKFKFFYPPDYAEAVDHICSEHLTHYTICNLWTVRCILCKKVFAQSVVDY